ncbi:RNA degradosome polyphosphate kinase [Fundicoccus culcitae]|uniref:Polyphosphate kinase n=1 Tax=Fundicoccus culcitae TaxID=2969821 RepID=A0ABY5P278_9LACT|nr:RNA degradosome polyphosphate kinase [Fundicoccus culcitae]UUX32822.1 RNA degradosome polyphosphate kinase [Fundicoccus culcitae]
MANKNKKVKSEKPLKKSFTHEDVEETDPLDHPENYFNRELSWLDFNYRVIDEANDLDNPFLEQLNFIAIGSSNLDEFFMVRVAGVYDQYLAGVEISENKTYMSPKTLLKEIQKSNQRNITEQYRRYHELIHYLPNYGYQIKRMAALNEEEVQSVKEYFDQMILPTLSPIGIDAYKAFPHLINKAINIMVVLEKDGATFRALVPVPPLLDRYKILIGSNQQTIVFTEDIMIHFIDSIFEGYTVTEAFPFRITRNADFNIREEGASDLLAVIEDYVKQRRNGMAIRLEIDSSYGLNSDSETINFLCDELELELTNVYHIDGPLDLTYLFNLIDLVGEKNPQALYKPFEGFLNPKHLGLDLFESIKEKDLFFHHPYDSFQPVVSFIETAAEDPRTIAIKQTLYRVSKNSPIIAALKRAAENGKEVTVLVELKARFDEENNVFWARELEEAGCHVLYGMSDLKTHSKITLIIQKEDDKIQRYVHLGTGNYNEKTAKQYTDMGIMSKDEELTDDASKFFNYLSGYAQRPEYKHLHVSPFEIRDSLLDYIEEEINFHQEFGNGRIIAKMNSLTDKTIIKKLYEASQAGVEIDLIIRGICCLKPGVPGLSETIRVRSIVGRLLEHSRVYYFNRNNERHLFLSSADMMTRNMIQRVEIEFPILDQTIEARIIDILQMQLDDTLKARELQPSGDYTRPDRELVKLNSQEAMIKDAQQRTEALKLEQAATATKDSQQKATTPTATADVEPAPTKESWFARLLRWFKQ